MLLLLEWSTQVWIWGINFELDCAKLSFQSKITKEKNTAFLYWIIVDLYTIWIIVDLYTIHVYKQPCFRYKRWSLVYHSYVVAISFSKIFAAEQFLVWFRRDEQLWCCKVVKYFWVCGRNLNFCLASRTFDWTKYLHLNFLMWWRLNSCIFQNLYESELHFVIKFVK